MDVGSALTLIVTLFGIAGMLGGAIGTFTARRAQTIIKLGDEEREIMQIRIGRLEADLRTAEGRITEQQATIRELMRELRGAGGR